MNYNFTHLLWCRSGTSDKIWGVLELPHSQIYYNFWGKRTGGLTFKRYERIGKLDTLARRKREGGYQSVGIETLNGFDPAFQNKFENQFVTATMFDKFHGEN